MRDVHPDDLTDTARLLGLFEDYIRKGYAEGSEAERLRFVAAAERAVRKGTRNPCGFFVRLVKWRMWENISAIDEEAARARIKKFLWERPLPPEFEAVDKAKQRGRELSEDALFVLNVWRVMERSALSMAPLEAMQRAVRDGSWTEVRYRRAEEELAGSELRWDAERGVIVKFPRIRAERGWGSGLAV